MQTQKYNISRATSCWELINERASCGWNYNIKSLSSRYAVMIWCRFTMTGLACAHVVIVCWMCNGTENPVNLMRFPLEEKELFSWQAIAAAIARRKAEGIRIHDYENQYENIAVIRSLSFYCFLTHHKPLGI